MAATFILYSKPPTTPLHFVFARSPSPRGGEVQEKKKLCCSMEVVQNRTSPPRGEGDHECASAREMVVGALL